MYSYVSEIYAENKKKFLIRYLLPFLIPNMMSRAVNSWQYALDIETVQLVTTKLEIPDTKITQTNTMEFLQLDLDT